MKHKVSIGVQQKNHSIPVIVDNVQYPTMTDMMNVFHINQTAIYDLEKQGYSREESIRIAIERAEKRAVDKERRNAETSSKKQNVLAEPKYGIQKTHSYINPPPIIPDVQIWCENNEEIADNAGVCKDVIYHKRYEKMKIEDATTMPFCPSCDYPLFIYDTNIGDYVWGYSGKKFIYHYCPGCGLKIHWVKDNNL